MFKTTNHLMNSLTIFFLGFSSSCVVVIWILIVSKYDVQIWLQKDDNTITLHAISKGWYEYKLFGFLLISELRQPGYVKTNNYTTKHQYSMIITVWNINNYKYYFAISGSAPTLDWPTFYKWQATNHPNPNLISQQKQTLTAS